MVTGARAGDPAYGMAAHRAGKIELTVANNGTFGKGFTEGGVTGDIPDFDFFTGEPVASCLYPRDSSVEYLFGAALWVGAVVGNDTLVSTGADGWLFGGFEFSPDEAPSGNMLKRVHPDPEDPLYDGARSEEDYVAVYTDTFTNLVGYPHRPLGIKVTQTSYAWSNTYEEDFVLMHYGITNIGTDTLRDLCVGFFVDADVVHAGEGASGVVDDLFGFIETASYDFNGCDFIDAVNIAWIADADGDPEGGSWGETSVRHVTGMSIVAVPMDSTGVSYNWWVSNGNPAFDFGPRHKDADYDFGSGGTGTPTTDADKYYLMRNGEIDYDQCYTGVIAPDDEVWEYPPQEIAADLADGADTKYLLSVRAHQLWPGQTFPITVAYVGGVDVHQDPANGDNLPANPDEYAANLDFSDLAHSARWARWVYDNPGIDTDSDGYSGRFVTCDGDTFWTKGDGVPDFKDPVIIDLDVQNLVFTMSAAGGELPPPKSVHVASPYDPGGLIWDVSVINGPWLQVDKTSGDYPDSVTVSVVDSTLPAGAYTALLKFRDPEAQNSPMYVNVSLMVEASVDVGDCVAKPGGSFSVPVNLYAPQPVYGFTVPLVYETTQPDKIRLDSVVIGPTINGEVTFPNDTTVIVRRDKQEPPLPDSSYTEVANFYFSVDPAATEEIIIIDTTAVTYEDSVFSLTFDYNLKAPSSPAFDWGQITIGSHCCVIRGDIDGSAETTLDISDLVYLVDYMFRSGPEPACLMEANVDASPQETIDIGDLVYLIDYMMTSGPPPVACPPR